MKKMLFAINYREKKRKSIDNARETSEKKKVETFKKKTHD